MSAILAMVPWDLVATWAVTEAGSYFCGKTNRFKANSLGELVTNIFCWTIDKDQEI